MLTSAQQDFDARVDCVAKATNATPEEARYIRWVLLTAGLLDLLTPPTAGPLAQSPTEER